MPQHPSNILMPVSTDSCFCICTCWPLHSSEHSYLFVYLFIFFKNKHCSIAKAWCRVSQGALQSVMFRNALRDTEQSWPFPKDVEVVNFVPRSSGLRTLTDMTQARTSSCATATNSCNLKTQKRSKSKKKNPDASNQGARIIQSNAGSNESSGNMDK